MKKYLQHHLLKATFISIRLCLIVAFLFLQPKKSWSQKKLLSPSNKVTKIAFIDHSKLRKDFKAFSSAKEKMAKENESAKKSFDNALKLLADQTKEQLRLDSLAGGQNREQIIMQASVKKSQIINAHQVDQKKRNQDRIILMQDYERQIVLAIDKKVSDGGFTEIRPAGKNTSGIRGIDITELILKQLN